MTKPTFLVLSAIEKPAEEWLEFWAKRYDDAEDEKVEAVYRKLIANYNRLSPDDFVLMGQWKDGALGAERSGRWKENVAMVAYRGWSRAATELPKCPSTESAVKLFLEEWSEWRYPDTSSRSSDKMKRFGLSRASTMLHFISGGEYPILDGRVRTAIGRLRGKGPEETVGAYLNDVCPFVGELSRLCNCHDVRTLDKALFSYGASAELGRLIPTV